MKYLLIVFWLNAGAWPFGSDKIDHAQLGPYATLLACEAAASQAAAIVQSELGASKVGTFCSQTHVK